MELSIGNITQRIPPERAAYEFLEELRWAGGDPVCPHCGSVARHYLTTKSQKTRTGAVSERRVWDCRDCGRQFSVLVGTIMERTKVPIRTWIFVIFELCASKNGVAAREIERKYHLTPRTAWFLLHRIREAMRPGNPAPLFSGRVVADETWIGGTPKNRHANKQPVSRQGLTDKTPVVSLVSRETGEVRSHVVADVTGRTLRKALRATTDMKATHLYTDAAHAYWPAARELASHSSVDQRSGEYVRGDVSTNQAENYFSQLKRSIDGTHHRVSREHLPRYLAEFDFRHSTRGLSDTIRMKTLMAQVAGRRLMYSDSR